MAVMPMLGSDLLASVSYEPEAMLAILVLAAIRLALSLLQRGCSSS